jgi:hypothetical protein
MATTQRFSACNVRQVVSLVHLSVYEFVLYHRVLAMTGGNISIQRAVDAFIDFAESRVNLAREADPTCSRDEMQSTAYLKALHELAEQLSSKIPTLTKVLTEAGFKQKQSTKAPEGSKPSRGKHDPKVDLAIFEFANIKVSGFYDSELFEYLTSQSVTFNESTIRTKLSRFSSSPNFYLKRLGNKRSGSYRLSDEGRRHLEGLQARHNAK